MSSKVFSGCVLCSDVIPGGTHTPRKESISSFLRLFQNCDVTPDEDALPNFATSEYFFLCLICLNKMEVVHALFVRFDMIRKELSDYRQNFKEILVKSTCFPKPSNAEVNDLRSEIVNELLQKNSCEKKGKSDLNPEGVTLSSASISMCRVKVEPEPSESFTEESSELGSEFILPHSEDQEMVDSPLDSNLEDEPRYFCPINRNNKMSPVTNRPVHYTQRYSPMNQRPKLTIIQFICRAILSQPCQQATLRQIYSYMTTNSSYYRNEVVHNLKRWQNSVRHTLSINNQMFRKVNSEGEEGRGWWAIKNGSMDPQVFINSKGRKGSRSRQIQSSSTSSHNLDSESDSSSEHSEETKLNLSATIKSE